MQLEERGNFIQKFITSQIILCSPSLRKKDFQKIMYDFSDKLIFIKKNNEANSIDDYIPCLFYRRKESNNFLIYFHGNSENIFQIENYGLDFRSYLEMNVILVEYPGYFLKSENSSDPNIFFGNSLIVYDWIKSTFKASDNQIFVCGRSLGTSPSIYLSSHRNPKALFLISAFTSVRNVGSDKYLSIFVEQIFKSIDYIEDIKCPILFIHGAKDNLVSYHHSEQLRLKAKKNNDATDINIRPEKDHNNLNLKEDIIDNIIKFCSQKKILINENNQNLIYNTNIIKDEDLYKIPLKIKKRLITEIFDINEFVIETERKIEKKDVSFLMNLNKERIAAMNDSSISIYNDSYLLYYEIDLNQIKKSEVVIKSIYQMKNGNLICATEEGDIFIFKINKKGYEIVDTLSIDEEIFKIGEFCENNICLLSKNSIEILDNNFMNIVAKTKNNKTFSNFSLFSKNGLALIKQGHIGLAQFDNNNNQINIFKEIKIKQKISSNAFIGTDKYLIVGVIGQIYFYNIEKNYELEYKDLNPDEEITFILKIHDQLLLASTNKGSILQINIYDYGQIYMSSKFIDNIPISSFLMFNLETILISRNYQIDILSIPRKDEKNKNCEIF